MAVCCLLSGTCIRLINAGMAPSVRLYGKEEGGDSPRAYTASRDVSCGRSADQRCADPKILSPHESAILTIDGCPRMQQEQNIGSIVSPRQH